jgi:hypothetical protein
MNLAPARLSFLLQLLFAFLVGCVLVAYLAQAGHSNTFFNSDYVQPYLLGDSIIKDGLYAIQMWSHSPSLYVFPDWLLGALAVQAGPWWAPLLYGGVALMVIASCAGFILSEVRGTKGPSVAAFALCLLLAVVALQSFWPGSRLTWLIAHLLAPFVHTGAVMAVMVAMALLMKLWGRADRSSFVVLGIVGALATFSDTIFLIWFAVPATVLVLLDGVLARTWGRLPFLVPVLLVPMIVGLIENTLNRAKGSYLQSGSLGWMESAAVLWTHIQEYALHDGPMVLMLTLVAAAIAVALMALRKARRGMSIFQALQILLAGMAVISILGPVMAGLYATAEGWRYAVVLPLLLILWCSTLLWFPRAVMVPGLLALFIAVQGALSYQGPDITLEQCLPRRTALAGYWQAKSTLFATSGRIHVVQLGVDAEHYRFNYNDMWLRARMDDGSPFVVHDIIADDLDAEALRAQFGDPAIIESCEGREIWRYREPVYRSGGQLGED